MNYYIDFDNTLYNTSNLTSAMVQEISKKLCEYNSKSLEDSILEVKSKFNKTHIYNIFELCEFFAKEYNFDAERLKNDIINIVKNGKDFLYSDSLDFLIKLKENGNNLIMLTYSPVLNNEYQLLKINGSGISNLFDNIIITSKSKGDLGFDLDYENSVFIDDNPDTLAEIHARNPKKLIRINRPNSKYYKEIVNFDVETYENLKDII